MSRLNEIHAYLKTKGLTKKQLATYDLISVSLAKEIMEYAHRNQKRVNHEEYANHPSRILANYQSLVGISTNEVDTDKLLLSGIPFEGVQEVCILHDVIEDTDFTLEDIKDIFKEVGGLTHFEMWIEDALKRITHIKEMPYHEYINIVLENPISSLVKLLDLNDNLTLTSLNKLDVEEIDRCHRYIEYARQINSKYHFLERIQEYRKEVQKWNTY